MKPFLTQLIHRLAKTFQKLLNKLPSHPISHLPASKVKIHPIIMIPGSSATENRFNRMVKKLNRNQHSHHSLVRIKVWNDGHMTYRGHLKRKDRNPIFVVGFQNNRDGYENIKQQIESLKLALTYLLDHYYFTEFKAVGHSNGGLVLTGLLESGFLEKKKLAASKMAIIGSPYKFNQEMYNDFQRWKHRLEKEVEVLNFVGSFAGKSDGIVPLSSAQAAKSIFENQTYSEVNLKGRKAHHSALPTNPELVKQLSQFLNL
ncbi:alpha/beta hydrolase [Streptococcus sp. Marseille-P7376]|uniref:alpha/beta hydrolase n=1 Tax=Streptococcus sp. Marseille-P7376 TaxID=2592044 RepID=UPI0011E7A2C6|nr:alpha/beta hydrolase [Streptococcus sp. Marseille-P7376]